MTATEQQLLSALESLYGWVLDRESKTKLTEVKAQVDKVLTQHGSKLPSKIQRQRQL